MTNLDERAHRAAVAALLESALGAGRVYDYGTVPGDSGNAGVVPPIFALLTVERSFTTPAGMLKRTNRSAWRVSVRYVGAQVDGARWANYKITQALDGVRLSVGSDVSTPLLHEVTDGIQPDAGRFSGLVSYVYGL